jgi:uncharacterized membrane protein
VDLLSALVPVFLASVVECVEAWTIVVAVGLTRGWRAPLLGTLAALCAIGLLLAVFGVTLVDRIDEQFFEIVVGIALLLFGLRWLRKSILRSASIISLHDEDRIFAGTVAEMSAAGARTRFDWIGFVTAAKAMLLEGLEITFLVITLGAEGRTSFAVASAGAAAAFVFVGVVGLAARGPLSRVPENTMKQFVGVMLCTFGTYWVAEGFGVEWPGGSWTLMLLFGGWAAVAWAVIRSARSVVREPVLTLQVPR